MNKEIIEQIKNYGYEVEIQKDGYCTEFVLTKQTQEFEMTLSEEELVYYLDAGALEEVKKEVVWLLIEEVERKAIEKNKWLIIDEPYEIVDVLEKRGYVWLDEQKDVDMGELEILTDEGIPDQAYMVSQATANKIATYMKTYTKMCSILQKYNDKQNLYYYEEEYDEHCLHIDGMDVDLSFQLTYEGITMVVKETKTQKEKQRFEKMETMMFKKYFDEWLIQIKKQQKIKKIFNPSSFFFERLIEELSLNQFSAQIKEVLLDHFSQNEMEEISSSYLKTKLPDKHQLTHATQFFYFNSVGVLLNAADDKVQVIQKTENIQKELYELLHKEWKKEVKHALKDI